MTPPRPAWANKKRDANEPEIIAALEAIGCTVVKLHEPLDLLVGYRGITFMIEVKNPEGRDRLQPDQAAFIATWKGRKPEVVRTVEEAVAVVTGKRVT